LLRQPLIGWALSLNDEIKDLTLERLREDCTAYLVPEIQYDSDKREVLEWCFAFQDLSESRVPSHFAFCA
jgi:hypothetical protein